MLHLNSTCLTSAIQDRPAQLNHNTTSFRCMKRTSTFDEGLWRNVLFKSSGNDGNNS